MFFSVLKNRKFWIAWLVLSIVAGVIAYFIVKSKDSDLMNKNLYYATEFRKELKHSSIIAVQSPNDTANYVRYFKGESNIVEFRFTDIPEGTELHVLRFSTSKELAKIAIRSNSTDRVKGTYSEYWIWYKFLTHSKE